MAYDSSILLYILAVREVLDHFAREWARKYADGLKARGFYKPTYEDAFEQERNRLYDAYSEQLGAQVQEREYK